MVPVPADWRLSNERCNQEQQDGDQQAQDNPHRHLEFDDILFVGVDFLGRISSGGLGHVRFDQGFVEVGTHDPSITYKTQHLSVYPNRIGIVYCLILIVDIGIKKLPSDETSFLKDVRE